MATSSVPALKANLAAALQARPNLKNVQVVYGAPLPNPSREYVWLADVEGVEDAAALGHQRHSEVYNLAVIIQAIREGQDQQSATERAYLFRDEIDTQLRSDPTVAHALGSGWALLAGPFKLEEAHPTANAAPYSPSTSPVRREHNGGTMGKSIDLNYVGPHGVVNVPMPLGGFVAVAWGDTFTTTEEHAASLLQQPANWQQAPTKKAAKKEEE